MKRKAESFIDKPATCPQSAKSDGNVERERLLPKDRYSSTFKANHFGARPNQTMNRPPTLLDGAKVLYYCSLAEPVQPTGTHYIMIDGRKVFPANAAICQYENSPIFYRFYCDEAWEVLSDFDHLSVEEAVASVEHSYKGATQEFKRMV